MKGFHRQLNKFPRKDTAKLVNLMEKDFNPYGGDIKKVKGETNIWRKRAGSYRIFYEVYQTKNLVHVFNIERRSSKTY